MDKFPNEPEMKDLLDREIENMGRGLKEYVKSTLVPLQEKILKWEYGKLEEYPAWVFADFKERNVGAAYCLGGYGESGYKWGIIFLNKDYFGMNSGWYKTLEELYRDGWYEGI